MTGSLSCNVERAVREYSVALDQLLLKGTNSSQPGLYVFWKGWGKGKSHSLVAFQSNTIKWLKHSAYIDRFNSAHGGLV